VEVEAAADQTGIAEVTPHIATRRIVVIVATEREPDAAHLNLERVASSSQVRSKDAIRVSVL
jgi:hypothetical protein